MTPRVTFYRTKVGGQEIVGTVTLDGGKVVSGGDDGKDLLALLLDSVDRSDEDAVRKAMRQAPERFDGAYLRAAYDEEGSEAPFEEGGPGSGHKGHRGIPHYQGGSIAQGALQFKPKEGRWDKGVGGFDTTHMKAYAQGESELWTDELTRDERYAASAYAGSAGFGWNRCLRKNYGCTESKYEDIGTLKQSLDKGSGASEDMVLYRGLDWGELQDLGPGDTFTDQGFASCTANAYRSLGFGDSVLEIEIPKGTKGAWLQDVSTLDEEVEFLLQRGAQFAVVGKRTIEMPREVIGTAGGPKTRFKEVLRVQVIS